ncbi:MAG: protease modulator HflC [Pseudomonadota bacterium]
MKLFLPVAILLALFVGLNSLFVVKETEFAIKFRLGEILRSDYEPGLHFKMPFINNVIKLERRLITLDMQPERMNTLEQKFVEVDAYVKWQITNPDLFYTATSGGNFSLARSRLSQLINEQLRREFASLTLSEVVSEQRRDMMDRLQGSANTSFQQFGIDVRDVRIKRIELTEDVLGSVFERMETQRTEFANELRSLGREQSEEIRAEADREVRVLLAEAERDAARMRGDGDAQATRIYAEAYELDPEFYAFLRSLEAYGRSFGANQDVLLMDTESDFFRYFGQQQQ